jgi:molecular chaperone GrpE (heat shock protein)
MPVKPEEKPTEPTAAELELRGLANKILALEEQMKGLAPGALKTGLEEIRLEYKAEINALKSELKAEREKASAAPPLEKPKEKPAEKKADWW